MTIPKEILLQVLLEHPDFRDFKEVGSDHRNSTGEQSLTLNGLKDFKSDEFTSLFNLLKARDQLDEARQRAGLPKFKDNRKESKISLGNCVKSSFAEKIWGNAEVNSEELRAMTKQYLEFHRKIPVAAFEDLVQSGWLRIDAKNNCLIYSITHPQTEEGQVRKIQRTCLNEHGEKLNKKMLGNDGKLSVMPPQAPSESETEHFFLVIEGLESALSVRLHYPSATILISNGKANLKHVPEFLPKGARVLILSDHDINEKANQNGQTAAAELKRDLLKQGFSVEAKMSAEPKVDANDALQQNRLGEWLKELIDVPELPDVPELTDWILLNPRSNQWEINKSMAAEAFRATGVDLESPKVEQNLLEFLNRPPCGNDVSLSINSRMIQDILKLAKISAGILRAEDQIDWELVSQSKAPPLHWFPDRLEFQSIFPPLISQYLLKQSKALDVDFDSAALEMLMSLSVAIGGNKILKVDDDWEEKACLWLATVAPSGFGKTHLTARCGGDILLSYQSQLYAAYKREMEDYDLLDPEERKVKPQPVRKRFMEQSLTLEQLAKLHVENPTGVAIITDELRIILDGLGQYKAGRGNDVAKLLSLWNGKSFSNPVTGQDRFIPSVYVPLAGGIQSDLLQRLINDSNTADGLAGRFLFGFPTMPEVLTKPGEKRDIRASILPNEREAVQTLFERVLADREQERVHQLDDSAKALIEEKDYQLDQIAREVPPELFSSYRKFRTYLYRFCLLLHYLEEQPAQEAITVDTAHKVLLVMKHLEVNTRRAFGKAGLNVNEQLVQKVLDKLNLMGGKAKPEQIKNCLRKAFGGKGNCGRFLDRMIAEGILVVKIEGKEKYLLLNLGAEVPKPPQSD